MKGEGQVVGEMDATDGAGLKVGGVENYDLSAVLVGQIELYQQPPVLALGFARWARGEHRLADHPFGMPHFSLRLSVNRALDDVAVGQVLAWSGVGHKKDVAVG